MKETVYTHTDLLNLTRWITLLFLILLVASPHLRQQGREDQAVAFENAGAAAHEGGRKGTPGLQLQDQQGDGSGDRGQTFTETSTEWKLEKPPITGIPGPMAPVEGRWALLFQGLPPETAEPHASSSSCEEQPAGESKNNGPSDEQEKSTNPYDGIIRKAAERYEIDPALVKAIIMAESSYNPKAVSRKGAQGLMQLMPMTARALGVEDSFDPEDNIDAGVRYFKQLLEQFDGDLKLAIAAYNAGSRKVRMYKGVPPFKYTRYYVAKVIEYHQRYQQ
jgi:hypothetical protein